MHRLWVRWRGRVGSCALSASLACVAVCSRQEAAQALPPSRPQQYGLVHRCSACAVCILRRDMQLQVGLLLYFSRQHGEAWIELQALQELQSGSSATGWDSLSLLLEKVRLQASFAGL